MTEDRVAFLRRQVQLEVNNFTAQTGLKSVDGDSILELMLDMYEDDADQQILHYLCDGTLYAKPVAILPGDYDR